MGARRRQEWRGRGTRRDARRGIGLGELAITVIVGVLLGLGLFHFSGNGGGGGPPVPASIVQPLPESSPSADGAAGVVPPGVAASAVSRRFGFCHSGGGRNCVVDGDTFWMDGEKIRVADIDAPETHPARCAREADLGARATRRLHALLNAGPVALETEDRDVDRYGRKLRIVTRDGASLGAVLVSEGLARRWEGGRRSWCD